MPSVKEYAEWRGISRERVRALLRGGKLPGRRVGMRQWEVDESAYANRKPVARPMSHRMAWALIHELSHLEYEPEKPLASAERWRVQQRHSALVDAGYDAAKLAASWFASRGDRLSFRCAAADLGDLSGDERLLLSGVSDPRAGLSAGGVVEAWIRNPRELEQVVEDYLLIPDPRGNAVLHLGWEWNRWRQKQAPIGLVIADLADWYGPREDGRVAELIAETA